MKPLIQDTLKQNKGETLIIVIIISALLLTAGVAVMLFASSNLTTAENSFDDRETYYIARSVLETMDQSICGDDGEVGQYICSKVAEDFYKNQKNGLRSKKWTIKAEENSIEFDDPNRIPGYWVKDVVLTFESRGENANGGTTGDTKINISDVTLSFTVYGGSEKQDEYPVKAIYSYSGWLNRSDSGAYEWSGGSWETVSVEQ